MYSRHVGIFGEVLYQPNILADLLFQLSFAYFVFSSFENLRGKSARRRPKLISRTCPKS